MGPNCTWLCLIDHGLGEEQLHHQMCSAERWTQGRRGREICTGELAEAETGDGGTGISIQEKKFLVQKEAQKLMARLSLPRMVSWCPL